MQQTPLTHHDIIELILPFTRRGRHVDLNLSQRQDRRLAFKPVDHAGGNADLPDLPDLRETLQLEGLASGSWRLTRTLTAPCGLQASVQALGRQPAAAANWEVSAARPAQQSTRRCALPTPEAAPSRWPTPRR